MADLSDEDIQFIKDLRKAREENNISRRDALKALGMVGGGAAVGAAGVGYTMDTAKADASTSDNDGNVGTPSNRVDVFADGVEIASNITIGPITGAVTSINWDRPEILDTDDTVQTTTPQDEFRTVAHRLYANKTIEIDESQDYSAEDWVIPAVQSHDLYNNTEGAGSRLTITRQGASGKLNPNSVFIIGGRGAANTMLQHVEPVGVNPYDDENAVFAIYGGGGVKLSACGIGGSARSAGSNGVLSYDSDVKIESGFDFGTDLVETGFREKQIGMIRVGNTSVTGSVTGNAVESNSGIVSHQGNLPSASNYPVNTVNNNATVSHYLFNTARSSGTGFAAGDIYKALNTLSDDTLQLVTADGSPHIEAVPNGKTTINDEDGTGVIDVLNNKVEMQNQFDLNDQTLRKIKVVNNESPSNISLRETVIDENRGGTGNTAVVYRDASGTAHYWDADGTL